MPSEVEPVLHRCNRCSVLIDVSEEEPFADIGCPKCEATLRVRTRFDNFELFEKIASGGMGTVYKAHDLSLKRVVAIKLLRKEFSTDAEYIRQLENEARITASVNHPHVVKVFSFGSQDGLYYIAMELMEHGSLDDLMVRQKRLPELQVVDIGIQVAMGLRAAHQAGLIHRDVKPGNILLGDSNTAKIVDFGLALPADHAHLVTGDLWGTPYYVPPEKLDNKPENFRSDIYSLGATLFHAMAGKPPFKAETASVDALKQIKKQPVSLHTAAPDISSPTVFTIHRAMAYCPEERHASYDELIDHLEYAKAQLIQTASDVRRSAARTVDKDETGGLFGYVNLAAISFMAAFGLVVLTHGKQPDHSPAKQGKAIATPASSRPGAPQSAPVIRGGKPSESNEWKFSEIRRLIVSGELDTALANLKQLEANEWLKQPMRNWVLVLEGLTSYLNNTAWEGKNVFARISDSGSPSGTPHQARQAAFLVDLGRTMVSDAPLPENIAKLYTTQDFEPIALFALALKHWDAGQFDRAAGLFRAFSASAPEGKWRWIADFKPVAKRHLEDFNAFHGLEVRLRDAKTPQAKASLLLEIGAVKSKLQIAGKLPERLDALETEFRSAN